MKWQVGTLLVLLLVGSMPAAAQGFLWNAEFYNNPDLQGSPALTRQDAAIAFDWGGGAPAPGVNADSFSARWVAEPFFNAGAHRFSVVADDSVRVWVDTVLLIDTFQEPLVGQIVSADIALDQGVHRVRVEYREVGGNASIFVSWAESSAGSAANIFPAFPALTSGPWTAEYYANPALAGSPTLIQSEISPNHDWGSASPVASLPVDNWSARWTSVQALEAGDYQITVRADDGVRVQVNGSTLIDQFQPSAGQTATAAFTLPVGQHTVIIEFVEYEGAAYLNYSLERRTSPAAAISGPYAVVTDAYRLNVRALPDADKGAVIARINQGDIYPVIGRRADGSWWQIQVDDLVGWVSGRYVTVTGAENVPVIEDGIALATEARCAGAPPPRLAIGRSGRVTPELSNNLRAQASTDAALLGQIPAGGVFTVVGGPQCARGLYWWQVRYNGITGWTPEGGGGQYWLEPMD